jgi:HlyD family secretion protein
VTAGQVLIELEMSEINARVDQARARLEAARARYEEARAGPQVQTIQQAEAELRRSLAARDGGVSAVDNLERQWERSTELKESLDAAQSRVVTTRATLQAAVAHLDHLRAGARPDAVREAEEAVAAAEATARRAAEEEARMRLAYEGGATARRDWDRARTEQDVTIANLARARAQLADLRAGARPEELREAEEQVAAARAAHGGAVASLANARQLYRDRLPARQRLDAARADLRATTSAVEAARARVRLLRSGTRPEVLRQLQAEVRAARAALLQEQSWQRDLRIYSPITGVIQTRRVEPGEVIVPAERLLEIADPRNLWVRVYLPEREYAKVRVGDTVTVTSDSLHDQTFPGQVESIASQSEYTPRDVQTNEARANRMFAIKIGVDNSSGGLLIGMPAEVHLSHGP